MSVYSQIPLEHEPPTEQQMLDRSARFLALMSKRRTVRDFSDTAVPQVVIEQAIAVAGSAPSGANRQPWYFVAIQDADVKRKIQQAAEHEERELYEHRASEEWLQALGPLGTNAQKPFLQSAPWLIAVFAKKFSKGPDGEKLKNYYTPESVGIATGMLITALHHAGLATLTHTPSPMGFLREILNRPTSERPFLLLVTGYPAKEAMVPDIDRLALDDIMSIV